MSDTTTIYMLLLRWLHFMAGITWIGLLYFFNLVNVPWAKTLDGTTRPKVVSTLIPRALWWFRHGATVTVLAGILLMDRMATYQFGGWQAFAGTGTGRIIMLGGLLGIVMWLNVWFIIWPNQKRVIAAAEATVATGAPAPPEAPQWARAAFIASRTNFVLSLPMLVMMASSSHLGDYREAVILGVLASLGGVIWVWYLGQPKPAPGAAAPAPTSAPPTK